MDYGCHFVNAAKHYICDHCIRCGKRKGHACISFCKCLWCECCSICLKCNRCKEYGECKIHIETCRENKSDLDDLNVSLFLGKIFTRVEKILIPYEIADYEADAILFVEQNGSRYIIYKKRDCCCTGEIKDIVGDLSDLIDVPILGSECSTNSKEDKDECESETWTFYKFKTIKGYVDISWFSSSNGYYSEEVSLSLVDICMNINPYGCEIDQYKYFMEL